MIEDTFHWMSEDGVRIFARAWQPSREGAARGAVGILHGFGEHSGSYAHVARCWTKAGYYVLAHDQRGHGLTEGRRGDCPGYETLLDDAGRLIDEMARRAPGLPIFLYGHSMGGNVALNYVLRRKPREPVRGAIAASPWLKLVLKLPPASAFIGRVAAGMSGQRHPLVHAVHMRATSDPDMLRRLAEDPLRNRRITMRLFTGVRRAGAWALEHAGELETPLLLMHGDADLLTSLHASRQFAERTAGRIDYVEWPGFRHELHTERGRSKVLAHVLGWMDAKLAEG